MKLVDLLNKPIFENARLISGIAGQNNTVLSVNMMDAPDIIQFLKPNELLLTTAYGMKDDMIALKKLVEDMAQHECAGLGIKMKRFLFEIPEPIIQTSNELNFPIIELPLEYSLGELVYHSLSLIMEQKTEELRHALDMYNFFTKMIVNGKGVSGITENLSHMLNKPVMVIDHYGNVISQSHQINHASQKINHTKEFQVHLKTMNDLDIMNSFEMMSELDIFDITKIVEQVSKESQSENKSNPSLSSLFYSRSSHLFETRNPLEVEVTFFYPISIASHYHFLLIFGPLHESEPCVQLTVEQAANVIGFELMKRQALKEKSRRYKNEILSDVIEGHMSSNQQIFNHGKQYGLSDTDDYYCIVGKRDREETPLKRSNASNRETVFLEREQAYERLKKELSSRELKCIMFTKNDLFVIFFSVDPDHPLHEIQLINVLKDIQNKLHTSFRIQISFGLGNIAHQLVELSRSYHEACEALKIGFNEKKKLFIQPYRAEEVIDLLRMIPQKETDSFITKTLGSFLERDLKDSEILLETLHVYLANQCQVSETAKQLYVHRNTIIYRLEKCETILGIDLKNPNDTLKLRVALLIWNQRRSLKGH